MSIENFNNNCNDNGMQPSLETLLQCRKCKTKAAHWEEVDIQASDGFISFNCTSTECKHGTWYVCVICCQSFPRRRKAETHAATTKHKKKRAEQESKEAISAYTQPSPVAAASNNDGQAELAISDLCSEMAIRLVDHLHVGVNDEENSANNHDVSVPDEPSGEEAIRRVHDSTDEGTALNPHHQWLAKLFKDVPKATPQQVFNALRHSPKMQRFWQAEHNSRGGGIVFMVGSAFMRSYFVGAEHLPDLEEAEWHIKNFMQYVSMSEAQRSRHAQITMQITTQGSQLIKKTRIPNPDELKRFYMSGSQYSIYQALPIPVIRNIEKIAYVDPIDIITFAFAFGLAFDDISVTKDTDTAGNFPGKRHYVADSRKIRDLMRSLQESQDDNGDYRIALSWCTDWRDGFGVNRTKNNRKSVVAWTFSVSPAKDAVNAVNNTFAMAIGQKKNPAWPLVEHEVRKATSVLNDPTKPLELYHGGLKKIVRVFVARICSSLDKPERADMTGTINFNGNNHRSFGRLIRIETPPCNSKKVLEALAAANPNSSNNHLNGLQCGWSDEMIDRYHGGNPMPINGAALPACRNCRVINLHFLLGCFPGANMNIPHEEITTNYGTCALCANWKMDSTTAEKLPFRAPADYPTTCAPNCPVQPPLGRCTTSASVKTVVVSENPLKKEKYLRLKEIEFPNLVTASRFAFFNLVADKPWTFQMAKAYLTSNGIAPKYANELCNIAKAAKKEGRANAIDYKDPEKVDKFRFPAAWIDQNLSIRDYIETVMHEICLGVTEANFELCSLWMKARGRDAAFRRTAQELLTDLKQFNLNWLHTYPFSATDDPKNPGGSYGTGAWQGENWIAWIRISKVVYLHSSLPLTSNNPKTTGNWDVFRLVIAFTAMASRTMSHSGIDDSDIREFEYYLKEFFSCVRELDIQTRHLEMRRKESSVNTTEAQDAPGSVPVAPSFASATLQKQDGNGGKKGGKKAAARKAKRPSGKGTCSRKVQKTSSTKKNDDPDYCDDTEDTTKNSKRGKKKAAKGKRKRDETSENIQQGPKQKKTKNKKTSTNKKESTGGAEAWWTRSNYLSLPNLVVMMNVFGLLINYWDGGGKGEKFVQEVKPLIARGVQEYENFFPNLMEKLYKYRVLDIFAEMYQLFSADERSGETENAKSQFSMGTDGEITNRDPVVSVDDNEPNERLPEQDYSPMEDRQMCKLKTFFHYRSLQHVLTALEANKPVSGILVHNETDPSKMDFYLVYKQKQSYYGKKVLFVDDSGIMEGGLWYAPIIVDDSVRPFPGGFESIQDMAKMSTVAIPMSYGIGPSKPHSNKFCVITNWWKERQQSGRYTQPGLDPVYYEREDKYQPFVEMFNDQDGNMVI